MKTLFNQENFQKIIHSNLVSEGNGNDFQLLIDDTHITVRKPYLNAKGETEGNSIFVDVDGIQLYLTLMDDFLFAMWNKCDKEPFVELNENSPTDVLEFFETIWEKMFNHFQENENNLLSYNNFSAHFGSYTIPDELKALFEFEQKYGAETFVDGFYLTIRDASWGDISLADSFIEFAVANGSGSTYAYWLVDVDLNKCPIVCFGDEGGIRVVAETTLQLIHLLTFDTEISVDNDEAYFYREEETDYESENKAAFCQWVEDHFKLKPIHSVEQTEHIIKNAEAKYQNQLLNFLNQKTNRNLKPQRGMDTNEYQNQFTQVDAVGWLAIDQQLEKLYPEQKPKHYASIPHFIAGGENPLDGISVYVSKNQEEHYHFVTYGFSELYYNEEAVGNDFSKFGFELSFRLKKKSDDDNLTWACNLLQNIAKYVFKSGNWFEEFHVFPTNGPIRLDDDTQLTALAFIEDPELGRINTPHGEVQFLQIVGITADEFEEFKQNPVLSETEKILDKLRLGNNLLITDLDRK